MVRQEYSDKRMESLPRIAVCMTAFNGMNWIDQQIDSILAQEEVFITLYLSVDFSTDGTHEHVVARSVGDPRIRVLPYGSRFGGAARNFFRMIRDVPVYDYEYFAFADQDDIWEPRKLAVAVDCLSEMGAEGYSSNVVAFWPDGTRRNVKKSQSQRRWDFLFEAAGPGCTYLFSKPLWVAIRACVELKWTEIQQIMLHDWFCYAFARANGYKWYIDRNSFMFYRQHGGNQVGMNHGIAAFLFRINLFLRNQWLSQSKLIFDILNMDSTPFFARGRRPDRRSLIALAFLARHCRRRPRDQVFFFFFCLLLAIIGWRDHVIRQK